MIAEPGRARALMIPALIVTFVLMAIAIAVAATRERPAVHASPTVPMSVRPLATATATLGSAPATPGPPSAPVEPSSTPTARPLIVPAAIAARPALPFCGQETVSRQPEGDFYDPEAWDCFLEAREAGLGAELIRDGLTVEGGHTRSLFRLQPNGEIEWWYDATQDALGSRTWTRSRCDDLGEFAPDPAGTPVYVPGPCGSPEVLIGPDESGQPSGDEIALLEELVLFARSPDQAALDRLPLAADGVWIGLADRLMVRRTIEELSDPAAWRLDADAFRGRVGPFSALVLLDDWDLGENAPSVREAEAVVGEHPHCASPPVAAAEEVVELRRLSLQPVAPASCLTWWTVDLFIGSDGSIEAITLDLYEP